MFVHIYTEQHDVENFNFVIEALSSHRPWTNTPVPERADFRRTIIIIIALLSFIILIIIQVRMYNQKEKKKTIYFVLPHVIA